MFYWQIVNLLTDIKPVDGVEKDRQRPVMKHIHTNIHLKISTQDSMHLSVLEALENLPCIVTQQSTEIDILIAHLKKIALPH